MQEYYDIIHVVFIHEEQCYGVVEKLGAFNSIVRFTKDGIEYEEMLENEEFTIMDEIVHKHVEEDN